MKNLLAMMVAVFFGCPLFATTWYVNGTSGSDDYSGKSTDLAKKTIQAAIDAATSGDTILVAAGTYAPIDVKGRSLSIQGVSGAKMTCIDGGGTSRCITTCDIYDGYHAATNVVVKGFTICNGSFAGNGGAVIGGAYFNCIFLNNKIVGYNSGGAAAGAELYNCLFHDNCAVNGGAVVDCLAVNCTFAHNQASHNGGAVYSCIIRNCVLYDNEPNQTCFTEAETSFEDNPSFVDAANGDYRLASDSPCIDAGNNSYVTSAADLAGNVRIANGTVDIGCYEYGSSPISAGLQEGLVAWYKFDGNLNDASGNGYDMSGTCGGYVQGRGAGGQALSCAEGTAVGPAKRIEVEASFTISCWLKADEDIAVVSESSSGIRTNGKMVLISGQCSTYGSMSGAGVGVAYGKNGVAIYEHGSSYLPVVLMHSANVGAGWNHVVITVSNDNAPILYLNGEFARQGVKGARTHRCVMLEKDSSTIGGEFYGNRFNGCTDDFRIYNRALSAEEVKALYEDGGGVSEVTTYTITFDANGGSPTPSAITRKDGEAYGTLPTVTKSGFTFVGWYTSASGGTKVTSETKATGNVALYAHWTSSSSAAGNVSVTSVTAQQRYPWNGLVDITVTLQGTAEDVAKADCLFAATNSATKAAILVEHITRNGDDTGSGTVWTRKFIWDAKVDVGAVKIDDVALAVDVEIPLGGVQLWENGPYWAECNVGATKPEECGYYFWWGDTVGYKRNASNDGWVSVKDDTGFSFSSGNCPTCNKSISQLQSAVYIDSTGNLVAAHDAATAHLGAPWRMPTNAEFFALVNNCTTTWTTRNGVSGRLVTGKGAYSSKSIFLPAAGNGDDSYLNTLGSRGLYWSSTPDSGYSYTAWCLNFGSGYFRRNDYSRYGGQSVRPVRGFASSSVAVGGVTTHFVLESPICIVSFNANGGSCSTSSEQYSCGSTLGILPTAMRNGYEFLGWFTAAVGGTQVTAATIVTEDVTYYAQWSVLFDIVFNANGGTPTPTAIMRKDGEEYGTLPVVTRGGYVFDGWYTAASGGERVLATTKAKEDVTLYAHWHMVPDGGPYTAFVGGVAWTYSISGGAATVEGAEPSSGSIVIPSTLGGCPVTSIGDSAFQWCRELSSVTIPSGVTRIGSNAFYECRGLESVKMPSSLTSIGNRAFFQCRGLTSIKIPSGVTNIEDFAFYVCMGLTSVTIPPSVTSIGRAAFADCNNLTRVNITDLSAWCGIDFHGSKSNPLEYAKKLYLNGVEIVDLTIPEGIKVIGKLAFSGCSDLMSVVIPPSVTIIGNSAFADCNSLARVDITNLSAWCGISFGNASANPLSFANKLYLDGEEVVDLVVPEDAAEVGKYAFCNCSGLTSVTILSNVTNVGEYAFSNCDGLTSVMIREGVASMGTHAFEECTGLKSVTIPSSVECRGNQVFFGCDGLESVVIRAGGTNVWGLSFEGCGGPMDVTIQGGVTSIGDAAFQNCEQLRDVIIPMSVTNIGDSAFFCCSGLTSITMPEGVANIGDSAFYGCSGLTSITMPEGVANIGDSAFYGCGGLTSIVVPDGIVCIGSWAFAECKKLGIVRIAETLERVGSCVFDGCSNLRVVYYYAKIPPAVGSGVYYACPSSMISFLPWAPSIDKWCDRAWSWWDPAEGSYKITFDAAGGTCDVVSKSIIVGATLGALPTPALSGYLFDGWYTAASGGTRVTPATVVTEDVTLYAQWRAETIVVPVVDPPNGTVFRADDCLVTITTETDGAAIYYRVGAAPKASSKFLYSAPFTIVDTSTIYTYAMKEGRSSATNVVTITKGEVLTFAEAASAEGITTFITDGDAEWIAEEDANAKVGNASVRSGEIDDDQISWFTAEVEGPGTLSFWWKASCEADELQEFDHLVFAVDDVVEGEVARLDGITAWEQITTTVSAGSHTLYWAYVKDESDFDGEDCGWVDGIVWTPSAAPVVGPTIEGDEGATVTGDAETGFVVKPSERKTAVVVTIPQGVDAAKVTVEVSPKVTSVKPNGAKVKIVSGGADITEFLNVPAADGNGVVDLTKAMVKEEIVKEVLDVEKGAKVELNAADPKLTTAPTRVGLFYQLREGETLGGMKDGDSKVGDGQPWSPKITVKGGNSAFYSIGVGKGE